MHVNPLALAIPPFLAYSQPRGLLLKIEIWGFLLPLKMGEHSTAIDTTSRIVFIDKLKCVSLIIILDDE